MDSIITNNTYNSPVQNPTDYMVKKAEETLRRTNLQAASKNPGTLALLAAKYLATDAIRANLQQAGNIQNSETKAFLNAQSAINTYSNI